MEVIANHVYSSTAKAAAGSAHSASSTWAESHGRFAILMERFLMLPAVDNGGAGQSRT
jgi:hypothetical protein